MIGIGTTSEVFASPYHPLIHNFFSSFLTDKQLLATIPDEKWIFSMINMINMRLPQVSHMLLSEPPYSTQILHHSDPRRPTGQIS